MTPTEAWWATLRNYSEVATRLGRAPRTASADVDEQRSGRWAATCRSRQIGTAHARLSPDQIAALEASPFWYWTVTREQVWHSNYRALVEFVGRHHRMPVDDYVRRPKETQLAKWVFTARAVRRGQARGTLTRDRIELLESIPGWTWEASDTRSPVTIDDTELASLQRTATARVEETQALAEIAAARKQYATRPATWNGWLARYSALANELDQAVSTRDDTSLGAWAYRQRRAYRMANFAPQRIALLERTPGWWWTKPVRRRAHANRAILRQGSWLAHLTQYTALIEQNGRRPNRQEQPALYWWMVRQRRAHRNRRPSMSPRRIALLETAPLWTWSQR